jgi:hypothetical protein
MRGNSMDDEDDYFTREAVLYCETNGMSVGSVPTVKKWLEAEAEAEAWKREVQQAYLGRRRIR